MTDPQSGFKGGFSELPILLSVDEEKEFGKILQPISEDKPSGEYLIYEGTYDMINEARREDDKSLPTGVWEHKLKRADWKEVQRICTETLESRSKDLQIAVWLLEALMVQKGFEGLKKGLVIVLILCREFWDTMYPEILEDDMESRVSPIVWLNEKLFTRLKFVSITMPQKSEDAFPYSYVDWEDAIALEKAAAEDTDYIQRAEKEGKVTRARFLGSVMFTPISFYQKQSENLAESAACLSVLDRFLNEKCEKQAPSLKKVCNTLAAIRKLVNTFLAEKQGDTPDLDESDQEPVTEGDDKETFEKRSRYSIRNRADAYRMLSAAAEYLLMHEPHSPTPYLIKRAVSWGNMSLTELLHELVSDENDLAQILKLLGLKRPIE